MSENFNEENVREIGGQHERLKDYQTSSENGVITVYFRNLEQHLIKHIMDADVVIGAVAWVTSKNVLKALTTRLGVALLVNKEDSWRPDLINQQKGYYKSPSQKAELKELYEDLPWLQRRFELGGLVDRLTWEIEPIRCVGNYYDQSKIKTFPQSEMKTFPRMHNKFILFCKMKTTERGYGQERTVEYIYEESGWKKKVVKSKINDKYWQQNFSVPFHESGLLLETNYITPYAVWTGSFNFSKSATQSFENALYILDPSIIQAYLSEWNQIAALSESLDWDSDVLSPDFMIGDYRGI